MKLGQLKNAVEPYRFGHPVLFDLIAAGSLFTYHYLYHRHRDRIYGNSENIPVLGRQYTKDEVKGIN